MIQLPDVTTITDAIVTQATTHPDNTVITFLVAGQDPQSLTCRQLHADAQVIAGRLVAAGICPGDIVIVAGEHDSRLIVTFLAVLYAGATPTIAPYPSAFSQVSLYQQRLLDTVKASQARAVIALPDAQSELVEHLADTRCSVLNFSLLAASAGIGQTDNNSVHTPEPSNVAYLQFSSGTTGDPKGAVVTHAAALHHLQILITLLKLGESDVLVGWAPFYHDLGLIFYLLLPLASGIPVVTMAPDYWVRRPHILLRALHDYCGTVAFMPGFGFAHTARYVRQREVEDLELRCVRLLIAGAEVIQPDVLQAFIDRFHKANLARKTLQVGYGMTECVFMGSLTSQDRPPRIDRIDRQLLLDSQCAIQSTGDDALPVISCGTPPDGIKISIYDDDNKLLPERHVGEIVIDSPTLFERYLYRPYLTAQTLRQGRLYTGDLGYLADGELFVVDRKKDLIISAGKHIYPETLEQLALDIIDDADGRVAAFGVRSPELGTELPVLVCEVRGKIKDADAARLINAIRQHIAKKTNVTLADVRLVRRGWLVKTTSGKVARNAARDKYLAEGHRPEPPALALLRAAGDDPALLEQALTALAAQILGVPSVQPEDNFFELGGDSLAAMRMLVQIEEIVGRVDADAFFRRPAIAALTGLETEAPVNRKKSIRQPEAKATFKRRLRSGIGRRLLRFLMNRGPLWHGYGLPYGVGIRLQRALTAQPWLRHHLYAPQIDLVRRWHAEIGSPGDVEEAITISLLANTWLDWRNYALSQPAVVDRWLTVTGESRWLLETPDPPCGRVIAVPHTGRLITPLRQLCHRSGQETTMVANARWLSKAAGFETWKVQQTQARAEQLWTARRVLHRHGVVFIAADGLRGEQSIEVPFWGRRRRAVIGAAELAVTTSALLVPAFIAFDTQGRIQAEVMAPLSASSTTAEAKIIELTERYWDIYAACWPDYYASIKWTQQKINLTLPSF